ncbi:MAG: ATP-binding protein, partial [Bacteroidetes bacterium]
LQYLIPIVGGVLTGIFILLPAYEFVSYFDPDVTRVANIKLGPYIGHNWLEALTFRTPYKLVFYAMLGGTMAAILARITFKSAERQLLILQLQEELDRDLESLIAQGESETLEFKSSFRYDLRQQQVNKGLEGVIMKTLAGMMNSEGGTLLIGVSDEGEVLGLEPDYQALKRKDRDGFEQLLNNTVADRLGTPACEWIRVFFHQQAGKEVCRIRVSPAPQPVYVQESGKEAKFYIRTGAGTRAMTLPEAIAFIQQKWKR